MALDDWPERDRRWAARYILCLAKEGVTLEASDARQSELIAAAEAAGAPAADVFGDPDELAAEDAKDFADADVVAMAEDGFGLREALAYAGVALVFLGAIAGVFVLAKGATDRVDITAGPVVLMVGIAVALVAGSAASMFFSTGRLRAACGWAAVAVVGVLVGGSQVSWSGRHAVLVAGVPRWPIIAALLVPGLLSILLSRAIPERSSQDAWTDEAWFIRFRGVLVSKGVPSVTVREHERSLREGLTGTSAFAEYGRPDALGHRLAAEDPAAAGRRIWWGAVGWFAFALLHASFIPGETGAWLVFRLVVTAGLVWLGVRSALRARHAQSTSSKAVA
ncbi:hypothetical protein [Tsukamurella pulmonis]|uniref:hypothetical protein n=1 Tax=Tsukamurella pulmonis TaxID=47312 RepID=UPI0008394F87|nr:hypothetical protein [Tsukamurella pulmonis]RDH12889.1 hypothetical protein DVB88_05170 [Tsukamurella pulmonis]